MSRIAAKLLAISAALVAFASSETFNDRVCPGKPADLIIVMDESSSIWPVHFKKQREFLANLTDGFEISADKTRIAVVSFADDYTLRFHLNTYLNNEELKGAVNRISQKTGGTRTDLALEYVRTAVLTKARPDVPKIVILVTDGASWYREKTRQQADLLKQQNVSVIAVAISNQINWDEINAIASKPLAKHAFSVTSFEGLGQQLVNDLVDTTCEIKSNPPPVLMPHPEREGENRQDPPGMPTIRIYSERTSSLNSKDSGSAVLQWHKPGDAALERGLTSSSLSRHGSLKGRHGSFTIQSKDLFAVGAHNNDAQGDAIRQHTSSVAERHLLPASISVSARWSTAGERMGAVEIRPAATGRADSDSATTNVQQSVLHRILMQEPLKALVKGCQPSAGVDLAIVLGSIGQNPRGAEAALSVVESFVREAADTLLRSDTVRIALVPSACQLGVGFDLSELSRPQAMLSQLAQSKNKFLHVADHLNYVKENIFGAPPRQQANLKRMAIVILDRPPNDVNAMLQAVGEMRDNGVIVAFVGVGSSVTWESLRRFVQDERHIFTVSGYSHADAIKSYIRNTICH